MPSITQCISPSVTDMIRFDHSHVLVTFHQYTEDKNAKTKKSLADTICTALEIHATLEEEIFYPALRALELDEPVLSKSEPEHNAMRRLIYDVRNTDASTPAHAELLHKLMREVIHHVADEETVLLPLAEQHLSRDRLKSLGDQMTKRRLQLVTPKAGRIALDTFNGFSGSTAVRVVGGALAALITIGLMGGRRGRSG